MPDDFPDTLKEKIIKEMKGKEVLDIKTVHKTKSGKYIFVAKDKIHNNNHEKLQKDFNFAFKRLELLV